MEAQRRFSLIAVAAGPDTNSVTLQFRNEERWRLPKASSEILGVFLRRLRTALFGGRPHKLSLLRSTPLGEMR